MGIILGALGGAGDALQKAGGAMLESNLATERAQTLATFQDNLKNAPLQRLSMKAQGFAGQDVPLEAAPVGALSGTDANGQKFGMQGDLNQVRAQIADMPPGQDRDAAMAQFQKQIASDTNKAQAAVAGQTRKRSNGEAFDAALEDSRINDPVAYAAGRPLATDKTVTVADGATLLDQRTGKVIFSGASAKDARADERDDRKDQRQALAEAGKEDRAMRTEDARDRRQMTALEAAQDRADRTANGKAPVGYRFTGKGDLEMIPGGPAAIGKALPTKLATDLGEQAQLSDNTNRFQKSFKKDFANHTVVGEMDNAGKRLFGDDSGQAQWWQDYALHESTVRHSLFGASLTPGEQAQWTKLTVTPRMDSTQVKLNLDRRAQIENRSLSRMMNSASKGGYNKEQIEAVTGRPLTAIGTGSAADDELSAAPAIGTVMDGYVFAGGDPSVPTNWKRKP